MKKREDTTKISVNLPKRNLDDLIKLSEDLNLSRDELISRLIECTAACNVLMGVYSASGNYLARSASECLD
jgi:hypothetical protein